LPLAENLLLLSEVKTRGTKDEGKVSTFRVFGGNFVLSQLTTLFTASVNLCHKELSLHDDAKEQQQFLSDSQTWVTISSFFPPCIYASKQHGSLAVVWYLLRHFPKSKHEKNLHK
jgi:hypothetical protein